MKTIVLLLFLQGVVLLTLADNKEFDLTPFTSLEKYETKQLAPFSAYLNIMIDEKDNVFFVDSNGHNVYILKTGNSTPQLIAGVPVSNALNVMINDKKEVIISTANRGIYKYNYNTDSVDLHLDLRGHFIGMSKKSNDVVYVTNNENGQLSSIEEGQLKVVNNIPKVGPVAFDGDDNMYFREWWRPWNSFLMLNNSLFQLKGLSANYLTFQMVYNKYTDLLYIARQDGLFYLKPPSIEAIKIPGVKETRGIGFDAKGNIYIGTETQLLKLIPMQKKTPDTDLIIEESQVHMMIPEVSKESLKTSELDKTNSKENDNDLNKDICSSGLNGQEIFDSNKTLCTINKNVLEVIEAIKYLSDADREKAVIEKIVKIVESSRDEKNNDLIKNIIEKMESLDKKELVETISDNVVKKVKLLLDTQIKQLADILYNKHNEKQKKCISSCLSSKPKLDLRNDNIENYPSFDFAPEDTTNQTISFGK